ncbi:PLP-dependent transferase [Mollisia scopiformis]|uniref:aromatic-amino-acid transaminase n=1 Tax=Mollisia scopiformis TaxID=149040 RepID=A0A194XUI6_MOLSC|nr:PLP-dependent transferase [Mollisia scopiformis]KUJ23980.1 PLP-dependent transferase [Mollisia scopiformis]
MAPPSAIDIEGVTDTEAIAIPDPLSINGIASQRLKAGRLIAGTAAGTSSSQFKSPTIGKPKAKRWDHYLTVESKSRHPSALKGAAVHLKKPGLISLGGGIPLAENFPIEEISVKVPTAPHFSEKEARETGTVLTAGKYDASEGSSVYDLSIALNYGQGTGSAQMLRFITEHTELVCNPAYADWGCTLTVGSTSSLDKSLRTFCERGDVVLAEEYTYSSAVETASSLGLDFIPIKMDSEGLLPEHMDEILNQWDEKARGARKPHVLYTVPTGQNPTGATQSASRRKAIYRVAQKHDIYIFEDEPYFFLQMQPYTGPSSPSVPAPQSNEAFLRSLAPTYLSMDVDGRVMRMDSFSKVIAPGTRVGWITASEQIIERVIRANESSVQNPSGISQIILFKLLDEHWGHAGYLQWLINLRMEYTSRRDVLLAACEKFLPRDLVTWDPPAAGMFLWLKVDHTKHPAVSTKPLLDIEEEIYLAAVEEGVLVAKGSWFIAQRGGFVSQELFFRATFAAESEEKMAFAIERFGVAVRKNFGLV